MWALCERSTTREFYDYAGVFDLTTANHSFGSGAIDSEADAPVPDGENAAKVTNRKPWIANQGLPLNSHEGTLAVWIKAQAATYPVTAIYIVSVEGLSGLSLGIVPGEHLCFEAAFTNTLNQHFAARRCGFKENRWYRVAFTWKLNALALAVDGTPAATARAEGKFDDTIFRYRLFPGCCETSGAMSLAKAVVANRAWSMDQLKADFAPVFTKMPAGGVYVTAQRLGTIHRDVLGFADTNPVVDSAARRAALLNGLKEAGVTSVRYAGGYGGIDADLADWKGGTPCTAKQGIKGAVRNEETASTLDRYMETVVSPLSLDVIYTVNYGSNPPRCDSGGDPVVNGAELVKYANRTKRFGIRFWEIGNEISSDTTETDFHPEGHTGKSYVTYERKFYRAMKSADAAIEIAVPIGLATYGWQTSFDLPVLTDALYDAVIWHNYPLRDPISDGDTLYGERVATNVNRTRGNLLKLETELLNAGKSPDAIWVTEWNGELNGDRWSKQTAGAVAPLFVVTQLAEYMQAGVRMATWWTQGATNVCSTLNYDNDGETAYNWRHCGAAALVYSGEVPGIGEAETGLKPGELLPAGRGFQILSQSRFVTEGEHMLRTDADSHGAPWLLAYAATHGASQALILVNRDRDEQHTVPVMFAANTRGGPVKRWTYGRAQYDATRTGNWSVPPAASTEPAWTGRFETVLPPWSASVFTF